MNHIYGTWIKIPNGYVRVPSIREMYIVIGLILCVVLVGYAWYPWIRSEPPADRIFSGYGEQYEQPDTIQSITDPITILFDHRPKKQFSLRIISTMLGSQPTAIIDINGVRRHIGEGDSISGALVDSIGRGVVILRKGHEINRLFM